MTARAITMAKASDLRSNWITFQFDSISLLDGVEWNWVDVAVTTTWILADQYKCMWRMDGWISGERMRLVLLDWIDVVSMRKWCATETNRNYNSTKCHCQPFDRNLFVQVFAASVSRRKFCAQHESTNTDHVRRPCRPVTIEAEQHHFESSGKTFRPKSMWRFSLQQTRNDFPNLNTDNGLNRISDYVASSSSMPWESWRLNRYFSITMNKINSNAFRLIRSHRCGVVWRMARATFTRIHTSRLRSIDDSEHEFLSHSIQHPRDGNLFTWSSYLSKNRFRNSIILSFYKLQF